MLDRERWDIEVGGFQHGKLCACRAAALVGCRMTLVSIGWIICHVARTNRHRMHYSPLVGAPVLVLYAVFIQPEGTFHRLKSPDD